MTHDSNKRLLAINYVADLEDSMIKKNINHRIKKVVVILGEYDDMLIKYVATIDGKRYINRIICEYDPTSRAIKVLKFVDHEYNITTPDAN